MLNFFQLIFDIFYTPLNEALAVFPYFNLVIGGLSLSTLLASIVALFLIVVITLVPVGLIFSVIKKIGRF